MNLFEFTDLLDHIKKFHALRSHSPEKDKHPGLKCVKYVRPSFDMRDDRIFGIDIDDESFFCVNHNRNRDLIKWVHAWLDGTDDGFDFKRDDPELFAMEAKMKNGKK